MTPFQTRQMQSLLSKSAVTPLTQIHHPLFTAHQVNVWIKRDDLNHPEIQGNKFHKLKHNLLRAIQLKKDTLLTFGGAYSNHIAAVAAAGKFFGFHTIGFIRGEELATHKENWSPTLVQAAQNGMQLVFLSRKNYREKHTNRLINELHRSYPNAYIIPEGGTNQLAVEGFKEVCQQLELQCPNWTHLYTAVGTGGTLAGLIHFSQAQSGRKVFGVSTLKESDYLMHKIEELIDSSTKWQLLQHYHTGGYGKTDKNLKEAQNWFETHFDIPLDPIYTNKMVFGFLEELKAGNIRQGSKVILYHSGGLQGRPKAQPESP